MSGYTPPSNPAQYGGGGSHGANYYDSSIDFTTSDPSSHPAVQHAKYDNDGDDGNNASLFGQAIKFLGEQKGKFGRNDKDNDDDDDIDEGKIVGAHQALYNSGGQQQQQGQQGQGNQQYDADALGGGAAVQALKMFLSGDGKEQGGGGGQGGGDDQNKFIGLAMAQAGKMWDKQNQTGNVKTDKQSAINSAAKMALKMYMKGGKQGGSHGLSGGGGGGGGLGGLVSLAGRLGGSSGGGGGGGGGGGAAGLMNLAGKFLK
ncbi:hypothetical protein AJ80_01525 [Polytolypa hystricis UAMH7299]|uniref:DUF7721 domain-containing protein n=1 Tax=Polytolypa hystricis (strain UAMH7299) TaxID=1447883 RepID=A0A2B7Z0B7_POLH7|nr:hypothetical protein AJ80_01525 [Polytolypa hystricis UAMH7299]